MHPYPWCKARLTLEIWIWSQIDTIDIDRVPVSQTRFNRHSQLMIQIFIHIRQVFTDQLFNRFQRAVLPCVISNRIRFIVILIKTLMRQEIVNDRLVLVLYRLFPHCLFLLQQRRQYFIRFDEILSCPNHVLLRIDDFVLDIHKLIHVQLSISCFKSSISANSLF